MKYLLDTNVVIDYFRGVSDVVDLVDELLEEGLGVSSVTLAELYHGACKSLQPKKNKLKIDKFIGVADIDVLDVDRRVAQEYGKLMNNLERKGVKLAGMDVLIAVTAKKYGLVIITRDKKHFGRLSRFGLKVRLV